MNKMLEKCGKRSNFFLEKSGKPVRFLYKPCNTLESCLYPETGALLDVCLFQSESQLYKAI